MAPQARIEFVKTMASELPGNPRVEDVLADSARAYARLIEGFYTAFLTRFAVYTIVKSGRTSTQRIRSNRVIARDR